MPGMDGIRTTASITAGLPELDLRDRVQAVAAAYESGLIRPGGGG